MMIVDQAHLRAEGIVQRAGLTITSRIRTIHMKSLTVVEGIKWWSDAGKEYVHLMDEYQEKAWC